MVTVAPYGTWRSPITAELVTAAQVGLGHPALDCGGGPLEPFSKPADVLVDGVNVVPEPGSLGLLVLGAMTLTRTRRRA